MWKYILAIALQPLFFLLTEIVVFYATYICQEIWHSTQNFKASLKQTLWDLEFWWNHR